MKSKLERLKKILNDMESVLVAFSGGVDSTLLVKVARDVLGDRAIAVTSISEMYPAADLKMAVRIARATGIEHLLIKTDELKNKNIAGNSPLRCYFCKKELLGELIKIAKKKKLKQVLIGANKDDEKDYRPGMRAAAELGVRSPLQEAGFTKKDIRLLSGKLKLPTAGLPASPCLASRFPYGHIISGEGLLMVAAAEKYLKGLGLGELRVRHNGNTARIEVGREKMAPVLKNSKKIVNRFRKLGYNYVTLDLEGFRSGSLNEVLNK